MKLILLFLIYTILSIVPAYHVYQIFFSAHDEGVFILFFLLNCFILFFMRNYINNIISWIVKDNNWWVTLLLVLLPIYILLLLIQYPLQILLGIVLIYGLYLWVSDGTSSGNTKRGWCYSCKGAVNFKVERFGKERGHITCPKCGETEHNQELNGVQFDPDRSDLR